MIKAHTILLVVLSMTILMGCSSAFAQSTTTADSRFLTPIPQETLSAYRSDLPITNKLQAVIAARAELAATRLRYSASPAVISADELKLEKAEKKVEQQGSYTFEDRPGDTLVRLVIFEGEWQVIPPDPEHTGTPPSPSHGCVFVMLDAYKSGRTQIGIIDCP